MDRSRTRLVALLALLILSNMHCASAQHEPTPAEEKETGSLGITTETTTAAPEAATAESPDTAGSPKEPESTVHRCATTAECPAQSQCIAGQCLSQADRGVAYRRQTEIDFGDDLIEGELVHPEGSYLESRKRTDHQSLIQVPQSFGEDGPADWGADEDADPGDRPSYSQPTADAREAPGLLDTLGDAISGIPDLFDFGEPEKRPNTVKKEREKQRSRSRPTPPTQKPRQKPYVQATLNQRKAISEMGQAGEELWIIARAPQQGSAPQQSGPGSGELQTLLRGTTRPVTLPLEHTSVHASITGYIATVRVKQQFNNPYNEKIEVVYVFPLPQNAAVSEFVMVIGERRIRGIIRERQEAEKIYREARSRGHVASLLTQERPNVFTQKVANIEPQKAIDIDLTYYNTLPYRDGSYLFAFPMVVGPRFNPPGLVDGVGAVARNARDSSGQSTEVPYLSPKQRSGHELSLTVDLNAGVEIERIESSTHDIQVDRVTAGEHRVVLTQKAVIPNKDFVLRYSVAGDQIKTALFNHQDERGGFFTLMLQPPRAIKRIPRMDREMIFVLDCSGSMSGVPLNKAKRAVRRVLTLLEPGDSFQIIRFSNNASQLGARPLIATRRNIDKGLAYLDSLHSSGGTMMIEGIKAALDFPHQPGKLRVVSFMTDGYIGNETEILGAIHRKLGPARLFSFGVGSSVNRYLLERMAKIGRGAVAYVELNDDAADQAVDAFYERVAYPALSDIEIDWGRMAVDGIYPSTIPDLHVGRPVIITGRYSGQLASTAVIRGRVGNQAVDFEVPIYADDQPPRRPAIAQIWARMQISDLADRATFENNVGPLVERIKETALSYSLMSKYTAFVAVDSSRITQGDHGYTVKQPVPVPEGVRYDTTVQGPGTSTSAEH